MNKFWKWMVEKKYAETDGKNYWAVIINGDYYRGFKKQMLIGYMIEYMISERIGFVITDMANTSDVSSVYKYLEEKINEDYDHRFERP